MGQRELQAPLGAAGNGLFWEGGLPRGSDFALPGPAPSPWGSPGAREAGPATSGAEGTLRATETVWGLGKGRQDVTLIQSPRPPGPLQYWSAVLGFVNRPRPEKGPELVRWGGCKELGDHPLSAAPVPALGCPRWKGKQTD